MNAEPGADIVADAIGDAIISAVNFSEVVGWLTRKNVPTDQILDLPSIAELEVVPFDRGLAVEAGFLVQVTTGRGLSLGDRACLALAKREKLPALTADKVWLGLSVEVDVQLIR